MKKNFIDRYFIPDLYTNDIYGITPDFLSSSGIKAVLLDIDNTLVTYDDPKPTEKVLEWFDGLKEKGIKIAFISNNNRERVELFNKDLGFFASWDSKKPSKKKYLEALEKMGVDKSEAAVIGDQIFTDVWSGGLVGCRAYLVNPIKDKTSLFFRFKRALEIPFKKRYSRLHKMNEGR